MNPLAKFLLTVGVLYAGGKYGVGYMLSSDFEVYADRTKAPWTCHLENMYGNLHYMRDDFDKAIMRYSHTLNRCPESEMAQDAEFEIARCLEAKKDKVAAYQAYVEFTKKYPGTHKAKIADKAAEILHGN